MKSVSGKTLNPVWMSFRKLPLSRGSEGLKTGSPPDFKSYLMFIHHSSKSASLRGPPVQVTRRDGSYLFVRVGEGKKIMHRGMKEKFVLGKGKLGIFF